MSGTTGQIIGVALLCIAMAVFLGSKFGGSPNHKDHNRPPWNSM